MNFLAAVRSRPATGGSRPPTAGAKKKPKKLILAFGVNFTGPAGAKRKPKKL